MTEDITKAAERARADEAALERDLAEREASAHKWNADLEADPENTMAINVIGAEKLVEVTKRKLEALRTSHVTIFAAEKRELMRAELEEVRPRGEVKAAVAHLGDVIATFRRDAKAATHALRESIAKHNVAAGRATSLARQLGLEEEFGPIRFADVVATMNAATAPNGALEPAHQGSSHIVLGGPLDNPTHFNFHAKFGV